MVKIISQKYCIVSTTRNGLHKVVSRSQTTKSLRLPDLPSHLFVFDLGPFYPVSFVYEIQQVFD